MSVTDMLFVMGGIAMPPCAKCRMWVNDGQAACNGWGTPLQAPQESGQPTYGVGGVLAPYFASPGQAQTQMQNPASYQQGPPQGPPAQGYAPPSAAHSPGAAPQGYAPQYPQGGYAPQQEAPQQPYARSSAEGTEHLAATGVWCRIWAISTAALIIGVRVIPVLKGLPDAPASALVDAGLDSFAVASFAAVWYVIGIGLGRCSDTARRACLLACIGFAVIAAKALQTLAFFSRLNTSGSTDGYTLILFLLFAFMLLLSVVTAIAMNHAGPACQHEEGSNALAEPQRSALFWMNLVLYVVVAILMTKGLTTFSTILRGRY